MVSTTRQIHNDCYDGIQGRNEVGTDSFFLFPFLRNKKKLAKAALSPRDPKSTCSKYAALASQTAGGLGRLFFKEKIGTDLKSQLFDAQTRQKKIGTDLKSQLFDAQTRQKNRH